MGRERDMLTERLRRRLVGLGRRLAGEPPGDAARALEPLPPPVPRWQFAEETREAEANQYGEVAVIRMWAEAPQPAGQAGEPGGEVFLDIETTGLWGRPVFLVGLLSCRGSGGEIVQYLARDFHEEPALLASVSNRLVSAQGLVTFNGTGFDLPYVRDRCIFHRLEPLQVGSHLDLLLLSRSRWAGRVPDFKLVTLERFMLGRERENDVPARELPERYHQFLRTGDQALLEPILEHNRHDLVAMAELLRALRE